MREDIINVSTKKLKMDAKTKEYYLYCGIKTGWHEKSLDDFTNDEEALSAVRKYLKNSRDASRNGLGLYLWGSNGTGKCLGKGTKVILYDTLSAIPVESVKVGDRLLRPDGWYNTVLSVTSGIDDLFLIKQKRFSSYVVNSSHVLSLKFMAGDFIYKFEKGEILNISVSEYLSLSSFGRRLLGGWKPDLMQFPHRDVLIDPYFLGTWLGDGDTDNVVLTSMDATIVRYWRNFAHANGWELHKFHDCGSHGKAHRYNIVTHTVGKTHPLKALFKKYGLIGNKHIPLDYLHNSVDVRMQLLAGLLDTDGYRNKYTKSYEITQKKESLIDEIILLCRTLGLNCRKTKKVIKGVSYYKTHISIEGLDVPCRLQRKIPMPRLRETSTRVSGISVEPIGKGEYYGFSLDGDHLFLLEDFTVTHNSHLMNCSFKELIAKGNKVRIYSMDEIVDKFTSSWYSDEDKKELDNVLRNIDFLGIDEFGKNVDKDGNPVYLPELVKRVMESVIRFRIQMNKPIWFSSNTDPKFVKDVFSEDIASLLREAVVPLCVRGEDFRREIQRRNKRKFIDR